MRKLVFLLLTLSGTYYSHATSIYPQEEIFADQIYFHLPGTGIPISLADYVKLKPSDFKRLTGEKPKLKEIIALKITQRQIKKTIRKDGTVDVLSFQQKSKQHFKWHLGGFFLGLLLPVLGLIIAAFIKDDLRKNRIDSAAIGTCVLAIIFIVIILNSF